MQLNYINQFNPILDLSQYKKIGAPNKEKLAKIINAAKGKSRTSADFANECGISPSTMSRLLTQKYSGNIPLQTLFSIQCHQVQTAHIDLFDFLQANGYIPVDNHEAEQIAKKIENKNLLDTLFLDLFHKNISIQRLENTLCKEADICISTKLINKWILKPMLSKNDFNNLSDSYKNNDEYNRIFQEITETLLQDMWDPEKFKDIERISFVFANKELFDFCIEKVNRAQTNACISFLFIDLKSLESPVSEIQFIEYFLNRNKNQATTNESYFPILEEKEK